MQKAKADENEDKGDSEEYDPEWIRLVDILLIERLACGNARRMEIWSGIPPYRRPANCGIMRK